MEVVTVPLDMSPCEVRRCRDTPSGFARGACSTGQTLFVLSRRPPRVWFSGVRLRMGLLQQGALEGKVGGMEGERGVGRENALRTLFSCH
jgi:hypothetical protein